MSMWDIRNSLFWISNQSFSSVAIIKSQGWLKYTTVSQCSPVYCLDYKAQDVEYEYERSGKDHCLPELLTTPEYLKQRITMVSINLLHL